MNYESQKVTRTSKSDVTSGDNRYRLSYIVSNNVGEAVNDITATIHKITTETVSGQEVERVERIGSANVNITSNRSYLSLDKFAETPSLDRIAISDKFHEDVNSALTE